MDGRHCQIFLVPDFASLPQMEAFILQCPLLTGENVSRAMILVTEYFDNIVMHNRFPKRLPVSISITRKKDIVISLAYYSCNFASLIRSDRDAIPYYDPVTRRYRGIGLRMCHALAKSIRYRRGLLKKYIHIRLDSCDAK